MIMSIVGLFLSILAVVLCSHVAIMYHLIGNTNLKYLFIVLSILNMALIAFNLDRLLIGTN